MSEQVLTDAADHPMVLAALARLAGSGGWALVLAGQPLTDPMDRVDADLLSAAGVLAPEANDRFALARTEPWLREASSLGNGAIASLRRALRHAQGGVAGWTGEDREEVLNQGRASAAAADAMVDRLFPLMPEVDEAFRSGRGRFLDVGVGVGALASRMCAHFDGATVVGLDVLPGVLELARQELARLGTTDRVELRLQSVAALEDREVFDLAWLPQPFIPAAVLAEGVPRVREALRPGGWVVMPLMAPPQDADAFRQAVSTHAGHVLGGGPTSVAAAETLLVEGGFEPPIVHTFGDQVVLRARRLGAGAQ